MFYTTTELRAQTKHEELANGISHGIAMLAALIGAPFLILHATTVGSTAFVIGASIFAATIILLYFASACYHLLPPGEIKHLFRVIEHSAIFLLIAGTYTPILLGALNGSWGISLLIAIWSFALIGMLLKVYAPHFPAVLSTLLYLLMGWVIVVAIKPLLAVMAPAGVYWLVVGGLCYTVGVIFFIIDSRIPYSHFIWHLWVMAGTSCHYYAVYSYGA